MKKYIIAATAAWLAQEVCAAKVHEWPALPDGTLPDTEVATNIALRVNVERLEVFSLRFQVANGVSNEVLVAVGHDSDGNGDLSFGETAFVFGVDCGERYLVNSRTGRVSEVEGDVLSISHRNFDPEWNLAKVVKRGAGVVGETVAEIVENKHFAIHIR